MSKNRNKNNIQEGSEMEQNEKVDLMEEEMTPGTDVEGSVPAAGTDVPTDEKDDRVWKNAAGEEISKSAFIREQFLTNNKSRKEIADEFEIPYRTVYGATVNMINDAEPSTRGRGVVNPKIKVTADNKVLTVENDKHFLNGEEIDAEAAQALETVETDRNAWIKAQVEAGIQRGDVAKFLGLSYGVIYGLTKEEEGTRQKYEVTLENGDVVSRSEYIRLRIAAGVTKAEVAKELGVEYSVVWQATKKTKTEQEKFAEHVSAIEKFMENVTDPATLADCIAILKAIEFKVEAPAPEAEGTVEA